MKILIVDDIVINRLIIREIVRSLGHEYKEAENGLKALEQIKENDFDIIFLDIEMPVMNGLETAREIRKNPDIKKRKVPIFAITAYNQSVLNDEIDISDFNGVVNKPYSADKIKNLISAL
jgi:CheY-like chemotaxis protein